MNKKMRKVTRPTYIDYLAPDSSEIRLLAEGDNGGLCECTLGPGAVTIPVVHKVVEEVWYVVSGEGRIWRRINSEEYDIEIRAGDSVLIPVGTEFQFAAADDHSLVMVLSTMPPWGREIEAGGPANSTGPTEGQDTWKLRPPPMEWRIQGNWWQLGRGDDGHVQLSLVHLVRKPDGEFQFEGKSWNPGWDPRATFAADDVSFAQQNGVLRYRWTGSRGDDRFSGTGEMLFTPGNRTDAAMGYYTVTAGTGIRSTQRLNVEYSRMLIDENIDELTEEPASFDLVVNAHFDLGEPVASARTG